MNLHLSTFLLALAGSAVASAAASTHGETASVPVPPGLGVAVTAAGAATDLKFTEMFRLPIGPRRLKPGARLLALAGTQVRLTGYMASAEHSVAGQLALVALPVSLGDEDDSLSDDLPASAVFVHLSPAHAARVLPNLGGLMQLTGTLQLGAMDEPDGHVSSLRLLLDAAASQRLVEAADRASATPVRQP